MPQRVHRQHVGCEDFRLLLQRLLNIPAPAPSPPHAATYFYEYRYDYYNSFLLLPLLLQQLPVAPPPMSPPLLLPQQQQVLLPRLPLHTVRRGMEPGLRATGWTEPVRMRRAWAA